MFFHSFLCTLGQWTPCVPECGPGEIACAPRTAKHRRRRAVVPVAGRRHRACKRLGAYAVSPLIFNVFLTIRSISFVRVHGAGRVTRTCAASRGPLPSGRVLPWDVPLLRTARMARGARIRPWNVDLPLILKVFSLTAGQTKRTAIPLIC